MQIQIEHLKQQIEDYEVELRKLRLELSAKSAVTPQPESNHPSDIAAAFRAAAVATAEKLTDTQGLKDAIAALTSQLNQRQQQLQELEKQHQKQLRIRRVEEARQKIRQQVERIDEIAAQTESAYLDLKTLYQEVESDVRLLSDNPPGSYAASLEQLVHFNFLQVPTLVEQNNSFVLSGRSIDLFKPERDTEQRIKAERSREAKLAMDAQIAASQQRKTAQKRRNERQRIEEILSVKTIELREAEALRTRDMQQVSRGVRLNFDKIDAFIASTNAEIAQLQDELNAIV